MRMYTLVLLLLVHINLVAVATLELATEGVAVKDRDINSSDKLIRTSKLRSNSNEERMPPMDDWLTLKLATGNHMVDSETAEGSKLIKEATALNSYTRPHNTEQHNMELHNTELPNTELTLATAQLKTIERHPFNVDTFFQNQYGVITVQDLKDIDKVEHFCKKVQSVYGKRPDLLMITVRILEEKFERKPLANMLEIVSRKQRESPIQYASVWQTMQLRGWIERHEPVMSNLGFNRNVPMLYERWNMDVLQKWITLHNTMMNNRETMASLFTNYYGLPNLLRMLSNIFVKNSYGKKWAMIMQHALLENWKQNGIPLDIIFESLNMKELIKFITRGESKLITAQYPVIGEGMKLWIDILTKKYGVTPVVMELYRIRVYKNKAADLMDQILTRWIHEKWSAERVDQMLDVSQMHEADNRKQTLLWEYKRMIPSYDDNPALHKKPRLHSE